MMCLNMIKFNQVYYTYKQYMLTVIVLVFTSEILYVLDKFDCKISFILNVSQFKQKYSAIADLHANTQFGAINFHLLLKLRTIIHHSIDILLTICCYDFMWIYRDSV